MKRGDAFRTALLLVLCALAFLAIAFFFVAALDTPSREVKRAGTVTGSARLPSAASARPRILVHLDNGPTVEVAAPERLALPRGTRVLILEQTTKILGRKVYQFAGYFGGDQDHLPR